MAECIGVAVLALGYEHRMGGGSAVEYRAATARGALRAPARRGFEWARSRSDTW
jgi:hypothetical protein